MEGSEQSLPEPVKTEIDRISAQIDSLQQRLDTFIARRNHTIADRASERVASIVAAAERSATEIKAGAESDAARLRKQVRAEIQEVCSRLSEELQRGAGAAIARITDRGASPAAVEVSGRLRANRIAREARDAVDELQTAASVLEHSLRTLRGGADAPQRAGAA